MVGLLFLLLQLLVLALSFIFFFSSAVSGCPTIQLATKKYFKCRQD